MKGAAFAPPDTRFALIALAGRHLLDAALRALFSARTNAFLTQGAMPCSRAAFHRTGGLPGYCRQLAVAHGPGRNWHSVARNGLVPGIERPGGAAVIINGAECLPATGTWPISTRRYSRVIQPGTMMMTGPPSISIRAPTAERTRSSPPWRAAQGPPVCAG